MRRVCTFTRRVVSSITRGGVRTITRHRARNGHGITRRTVDVTIPSMPIVKNQMRGFNTAQPDANYCGRGRAWPHNRTRIKHFDHRTLRKKIDLRGGNGWRWCPIEPATT